MKHSKMQTALSLAGSLFLLLGIFSKPLGLSETWEWIAPILAIACFIPLIALQRRRRNARLAAGLPATEKPPPKQQILVATLSHRCRIAFWSVVAPVHRQYPFDFHAHHHIDHQLRSCYSRVRSQLAILE